MYSIGFLGMHSIYSNSFFFDLQAIIEEMRFLPPSFNEGPFSFLVLTLFVPYFCLSLGGLAPSCFRGSLSQQGRVGRFSAEGVIK